MIGLVGYLGVLIATGSAFLLIVRGWSGIRGGTASPVAVRAPALGVLLGALIAFAALELAIVSHDFSIYYVARNSATTTPFLFLVASGWAALEGSIVVWGLVLAVFTWLVARRHTAEDGLSAGALAIIGIVALFWFGMMATVANPFRVCTEVAGAACTSSSWWVLARTVAPFEGLGPNPLLQNHVLMAVHPPVLYLGYVGFTVPFAFAISALLRGDQGSVWLERTHRWTLMSWIFLTLGIVLGGWWSYEVLGWGGYWAWDPVENAAFLPWLVGTAFLHSAIVQRRRGMLQAWNLILVISTFAMTILGTFLTRSGVVASVHSFTQSAVGPALLGFLVVSTLGALAIFAVRVHLVAGAPRLESLVSREGAFLANNLLLTLFAFTVLVGTLYPILIEAFTGTPSTVGRPFFDRVSVPLSFALLLTMGVGPIAPYRVASPRVVWSRTRAPFQGALVVTALAVVAGIRSLQTVLVIFLGSFVIAVIGRHFGTRVAAVRRSGGTVRSAAARVVTNEPGFWGGQLSHVGVAIIAVAIALSAHLAVRQEVSLERNTAATVGSYCIEYVGPFLRNEPNRAVEGATVRVLDADCRSEMAIMEPRVHRYVGTRQPVATPDVRRFGTDDLYLSLARGSGDEIVLDVFILPYMWMLWAGGLITVAGGVFAAAQRRREKAPPSRQQIVPALVGDD